MTMLRGMLAGISFSRFMLSLRACCFVGPNSVFWFVQHFAVTSLCCLIASALCGLLCGFVLAVLFLTMFVQKLLSSGRFLFGSWPCFLCCLFTTILSFFVCVLCSFSGVLILVSFCVCLIVHCLFGLICLSSCLCWFVCVHVICLFLHCHILW